MKTLKVILSIIVAIFLIVGIPIIINECYKANCGYITVWDGSDLLGYYGSILGAFIAVITLFITIRFTKKQLQRENFLKTESEKWERLKSVFLQTLNNINPMRILKDVMDNGFTDPSKAINILQKYQMDCKTANDLLNAHLNMADYPKFKDLINAIVDVAEGFVSISQQQINQYSDFRILKHKDSALEMLKMENARPGSFSKKDIAFNEEIIEKSKNISYENINQQIEQLNSEFVKVYEEKYRLLLQLTGSTFETITIQTNKQADEIVSWRKE